MFAPQSPARAGAPLPFSVASSGFGDAVLPVTDHVHYFTQDGSGGDIVDALRRYGCEVMCHAIQEGEAVLGDKSHGAIVIDMAQLSRSLSFCRTLREAHIELPLIALCQSVDPFDEVLGLELGADEVVATPVHPRVLLARLRAISRRSRGSSAPMPLDVLTFGALRIDGENRDVQFREQRVPLSAGEFELLWLLARHAGSVMRRDEVLRSLRGLVNAEASRSIDARLYRLRRRFGDLADITSRIKTVRPYGYMFANSPWV